MRFRMRFAMVAALVGAALGTLGGCQSAPEPKVEPGPVWPYVCVPTAHEMLGEIETLARIAREVAPPPPVALLDEVLLKVARCRLNQPPTKLVEAQHCTRVATALAAARAADWALCASELEHGH